MTAQSPSTQPRAVLYLRQSTYREESISLELQEYEGRQHAQRMGYDVVAVESDPGISGRTWNRPAVQRVMQMLETGQAERVILWKWSRLSRDDYDWAVARRIAKTAGGRIESATEPNDEQTPEGRLMLSQMIAFAVYESDRIGSVWKETHARRRRNGLPHSGVDRFGYVKADDGSYTIDPATGPVLAEMYDRYVAGEGFTRIARWLNDAGHRTVGGRLWSRVTVTEMLDGGFGAGRLARRGGGRRTPQRAQYDPGAHPALIDEGTWAAYVARRNAAPAPARVVEPAYMLSGLLFCGDCGSPMHSSKSAEKPEYRCARARAYADVRGVNMRRALIEQAVTEWVQTLAADVDALATAQARTAERRVRAVSDREATQTQLRRIDQQLAQLTVRWMDGKLPESAYQATIAELDARRATLAARDVPEDPRAREVDLRALATNLAANWHLYTVLEQRAALQALVAGVVVLPATRPGIGAWRDRVLVVPAWGPAA